MPGSDPVKVNRHPARRNHWRKVQQARELIERNSAAIAKTLVTKAKEGDVRTARWLLEHTAATDVDGNELRPIGEGVDARGGNRDPSGAADVAPRILIGVALGADFARLNASQTATPALPLAATSHAVSAPAHTRENIKVLDAERVPTSQKTSE